MEMPPPGTPLAKSCLPLTKVSWRGLQGLLGPPQGTSLGWGHGWTPKKDRGQRFVFRGQRCYPNPLSPSHITE